MEGASDDRTRALAQLTVAEARRVIGILKRLERNGARIAAESVPGLPSRHTDQEIREAARRAAAVARDRRPFSES